MLSELCSPYAYAVTVPASPRDLFVAVLICSRTRQENAGATFSGGGLVGLAAWRMRGRGFNFAVADASFREYIADFTSRARRKAPVSDKDSPPLVAPVEFHLHRHLTEDRGWDDDAAWDCPVMPVSPPPRRMISTQRNSIGKDGKNDRTPWPQAERTR